jgi:hypothetical protein
MRGVSTAFDRQASCPNCGAPMMFRFAGAKAQVCAHCRFVVARTDQNLVAVGRMADLVEIPTPLQVGATGRWNNEPFAVEGRLQLDRASAPGAPWQETLVYFPQSDRWIWVAAAQGRWYALSEVPPPPEGMPHFNSLHPGRRLTLGSYGTFTVAEVGQRRVVSAEGSLPHVTPPGQVTRFADIAGPDGAFGTIDYGDQRRAPEALYLGRQIDPAVMVLDSGAPVEPATASVTALACPNCGGNLPIVAPGTTERVVCRYCGMTSDLNQGALVALKPAPKPPMSPAVPLGAEGTLRGMRVICIGFVTRSCNVDGVRYPWREYLLYAGPRVGYLWLIEEDGVWKFVSPIPPGSVQSGPEGAVFRGARYGFKQRVRAEVEYVVGEFYWKVEIGEAVMATEYDGPGGIVSEEQAPTEITHSFCEPLPAGELESAFRIKLSGMRPASSGFVTTLVVVGLVLFLLILICVAGSTCGGGSGGGVGPGYGGPGIGGPSHGGK